MGNHNVSEGTDCLGIPSSPLMPEAECYKYHDLLQFTRRCAGHTRVGSLSGYSGDKIKDATNDELLGKHQPLPGTGSSTCTLIYSPSLACLSYLVPQGFPPSKMKFQILSRCLTGAEPTHRRAFAASPMCPQHTPCSCLSSLGMIPLQLL